METNRWVIYDGKMIRADEPVVPVESRGLMYGDGCFETFRVYRENYFKLEAHLWRLHSGAHWLGMHVPGDLEPSNLKTLIRKLLQQNGFSDRDVIVRLQVWREGGRGYDAVKAKDVKYSILVTKLPDTNKAVSLATVELKRIPSASLPSAFKLCNNINYIAAAAQAREKGAGDALMQTIEGHISETTIGNLFWLSNNTVYTPSTNCDLLPGITRQVLIELVKQMDGLTLKEGNYGLDTISKAEALWLTNSVREIQPVKQVDKWSYSVNHPVLKKLEQVFADYVTRNLAE